MVFKETTNREPETVRKHEKESFFFFFARTGDDKLEGSRSTEDKAISGGRARKKEARV